MERMFKNFLIIAILLFLTAGTANALTLLSVEGTWSNVIDGTNVNYPSDVPIGYGNGLEDQVLWGTSLDSGQSGLGFTGISPPSTTFNVGDDFEVGLLRHFNNPIAGGSAASSAELAIILTFSDPSGLVGSFAFTFDVNETPNVSPNPDYIISFPSSFPSETFNIGGITYTLHFLGFGDTPGNLVNQFISPEGTTNSTKLWAEIIITPPSQVPEPNSLILLGISIVSVVGLRRKLKY